MKTKHILILTVSVLVVGGLGYGIYSYEVANTIPREQIDEFAQCIAEKEITMYGAEWCPHCKKEKARFGSSFQYIPYVECPDNIQLCIDKGIEGYPTWVTADGSKYTGEQGFEKLSEISGCKLPVVGE